MPHSHPVIPVIMCGGSGTRLWPLSRSAAPKQFVPLVDESSLLRETCRRVAPHAGDHWIAVANVDHRFLVAEQLRAEGIDDASIILEPVARNTAPAIAVAALEALAKGPGGLNGLEPDIDPVLLVLPSDHVIRDREAFGDALAHAVTAAAEGALVTFGVVPTGPSTGYGYIRAGEGSADAAGAGRADEAEAQPVRPVAEFVEKPDADTASRYLASGDYYWNSGMFVFRAGRYLEELERYRPEMLARARAAFEARHAEADFVELADEPFREIAGESIDYAVMEHTDRAVVVGLDADWSDVGSWDALWDMADKDDHGNATSGDVVTADTRGSYLRGDGRRLLAAVGLEDTVVVDTPDAVLVAPRARAQDVKAIVEQLKAADREEAELPARVLRPWGDYESLDVGTTYQVKRITVKPGAKLSIQKHRHRAEHWTVVEGTARVLRDDETFDLEENQSCFLPLGCVHRLENPGTEPLVLIEVQHGDYLGEDDIIRFEDEYGRVG
ncbi:MAG: mannose-1-phosphate guanylyltransferase/mannose-6-phosphate isomerase [Gemmatimonadota bacterium]|nr:mannose-1-phosphate guanylyltransferase/mannose-6-phosphate isomerase [Gemmatimonadota bacterium]